MNENHPLPDWAADCNCAITVCDRDCNIIYMNRRSRDTFAEGTDRLIGTSLRACHSPASLAIIDRLLAEGGTHAYTIEKHGIRKMIYQTAWRMPDGSVGGLAELSMVIDACLPHYVRG